MIDNFTENMVSPSTIVAGALGGDSKKTLSADLRDQHVQVER